MNYIVSGINLKEIFGVSIKNGVNAMLALPDRKQSLSHDFPEEDGIDIDLSNPTFSARDFTFNCILEGDTVEELTSRYLGLFTLLKQEGTYSIYNDFINITINVFYQKQGNLSDIQRTSAGYAITFDLTFGEADPNTNLPTVYLVDDLNRFLVP